MFKVILEFAGLVRTIQKITERPLLKELDHFEYKVIKPLHGYHSNQIHPNLKE